MLSVMTLAPKLALSLTALAVLGGGIALWAHFGSLVFFDTVAASFIGCFI